MVDAKGNVVKVGDSVIWWTKGDVPGPRPVQGVIWAIVEQIQSVHLGKESYVIINPTSKGYMRQRLRYSNHFQKV